MTTIGPSFGRELEIAGLAGLPMAWGADGRITFGDAVTRQQRDAVLTVLAAHDPTKPAPPPKTPRAFRAALLAQLDGVDRAAKLARAQDLRERLPGLTEPFLMALSGPGLSADEADIIVAIWSRIRALAGTPGEVLTAAEISRIEALAPTYLIRLV